jgi:hypothetical protein
LSGCERRTQTTSEKNCDSQALHQSTYLEMHLI